MGSTSPEIPLHTNATENTIRDYVTKRKVSGGTRSDRGRDCRDAFLGLLKTCKKQGVKFWDYLGRDSKSPTRSKSQACPHSSRPAAPPADLRKVVAAIAHMGLPQNARQHPSARRSTAVARASPSYLDFAQDADFVGAPKGNRTPVFAVRGRRPRPLDDGSRLTARPSAPL